MQNKSRSIFLLFRELLRIQDFYCDVICEYFHPGVLFSIEHWKKESLIIFEIIELNQWNLVFLTFSVWEIKKSWLFLKLTMSSLIIHSEWHIVTLVSNKTVYGWNLRCWLILRRGIQIWHLFLKWTMSSSIIHRKVTYLVFWHQSDHGPLFYE